MRRYRMLKPEAQIEVVIFAPSKRLVEPPARYEPLAIVEDRCVHSNAIALQKGNEGIRPNLLEFHFADWHPLGVHHTVRAIDESGIQMVAKAGQSRFDRVRREQIVRVQEYYLIAGSGA
jgi:hypothetical protein